jgi:hypothetical protein
MFMFLFNFSTHIQSPFDTSRALLLVRAGYATTAILIRIAMPLVHSTPYPNLGLANHNQY